MKPSSAFAILGISISFLSLSSCVDPYYAGGGVTVSTYQPGYVVETLPSGYRTEIIGGTRYYYHGDVYYRPRGHGYVVVESPHRHYSGDRQYARNPYDGRPSGYTRTEDSHDVRVIRQLPSGYRTETYRGVRYYRAGGTYYRSRGDGYVIVPSPF